MIHCWNIEMYNFRRFLGELDADNQKGFITTEIPKITEVYRFILSKDQTKALRAIIHKTGQPFHEILRTAIDQYIKCSEDEIDPRERIQIDEDLLRGDIFYGAQDRMNQLIDEKIYNLLRIRG